MEIIEQTGGRLTHFVAGLGTSGTFIGTGRRLREWRPSVRLVSIQPESPLHGLEGLKHMASAIVPAIYDPTLADRDERVPTEEAHALVRRLAREEGLLVGPSSGAALAACLRVADGVDRAVIVTIFPDGGDRYLSEGFWKDGESEARRACSPESEDVNAARTRRCARRDSRCMRQPRTRTSAAGRSSASRPGRSPRRSSCRTRRTSNSRRRFLIGPDDYRAAEARATETGGELLGFYHSHPDHPAVPSAFDLEHAWPNLQYMIVSVRAGTLEEGRVRGGCATIDRDSTRRRSWWNPPRNVS